MLYKASSFYLFDNFNKNRIFIKAYRTDAVVRWQVHFSLDPLAETDGLPDIDPEALQVEAGGKLPLNVLKNCAVLP